MNRRGFIHSILGCLALPFLPKAKAKSIDKQILARLDCGRTDCEHYGGLGCHGCDDPLNQTSCKLNLKQGMECLQSESHKFFKEKTTDREVRCILDCCTCGGYFYVLLEGGELWRIKNPSFGTNHGELVSFFSPSVIGIMPNRDYTGIRGFTAEEINQQKNWHPFIDDENRPPFSIDLLRLQQDHNRRMDELIIEVCKSS